MMTLVAVAMVCGSVLVVGHRAAALLSAKWRGESAERDRLSLRTSSAERIAQQSARALEIRRIAVLEREIALKERQFTEKPLAEPMPDDLKDRVKAWEDPFAQDEEAQRLTSLYAELRDWDQVRSKLPALRPFESEQIAVPREGLVQ